MGSPPDYCGLILAGGRSVRMGTDKAQLPLGKTPLLSRTVDALDAVVTIIVGSETQNTHPFPGNVSWVRESPPFAGPVAALREGVQKVATEWVVVVPCDLARPHLAVTHLLAQHDPDSSADIDGFIARDSQGREQWLTGLFRTDVLRRILNSLPTADVSVRRAYEGLRLTFVDEPADAPHIWEDMDTPEDVARVEKELS